MLAQRKVRAKQAEKAAKKHKSDPEAVSPNTRQGKRADEAAETSSFKSIEELQRISDDEPNENLASVELEFVPSIIKPRQ